MARILVADDDTWVLRMVCSVLEKAGHEVFSATDGAEALAIARQELPDLLISDVMMPDVDGWTLAKTLRRDPKHALMPIIFLTSLDSENDRIRGFRLGADDYIAKPFRFEELDLRVEKTLRNRPSLPAETASEDLTGKLERIGLAPLLTMLELERKSGVLEISTDNESATVILDSGRIADARCGERHGEAAMYYILQEWSRGRFRFHEAPPSLERSLDLPIQHILIEAARLLDERDQEPND